jgi:glycosyltransferase involved in cell wall biosynthesis
MDLANAPRISLVITSYNQKGFITDAVDSAVSLDPPPEEIILVDDASTDGSREILSKYAGKAELIMLPANRGRGGARNSGAARATGDYLAFLDGDDAFYPWAIGIYRRIIALKQPRLIVCTMTYFRGKLPAVGDFPQRIEFIEYQDYLSKDRPFGVSASSIVVHRTAFESIGGWSEDPILDGMEDQDLILRLAAHGKTVRITSPSMVFHRSHAGQIVNDVPRYLKILDAMLLWEQRGRYPGGRKRKADRAVFLGGLVFHWTRRAFRKRLFASGFSIFIRHFPFVFRAAFRRAKAHAFGRKPVQTIELKKLA